MLHKMLATFKRLRKVAAYTIILLTLLVFWQFIRSNPKVIDQLRATSLLTIIVVILLYGVMTGLLAILYKVMTRICGVNIPGKDNLLLTMYSSVVNFFGPLQSGPGFRTIYLKKKYGVNMAKYIGVSLLYYVFFGVMSGLFLLSGLFGYWIIVILLGGVLIVYLAFPKILAVSFVKRYIPNILPWGQLAVLAALSLVQVLLVAVIYFIEIRSIQGGVGFGQALVYTGAANFALFVSLTPGALGFRESFLYLSRDLHRIDQTTIISANIIDRGVYLVFLGILFVAILAFHGRNRFKSVSSLDGSK